MVHKAYRPPPRCSCRTAADKSRAPLAPSGCPNAIAPPSGLTCPASSASPSPRSTAQRLRGERFVQLDHFDLIELEAGQREHLLNGRHRSQTHHSRRDARHGGAHDPRPRSEAVFRGSTLAGQQESARAVINFRRVARSYRPAHPDHRPQRRQHLQSGVRARMFVGGHHRLLRKFDRHDFAGEAARRHGSGGAQLAAQCKGILVGAVDAALGGDILGGLGHRIDAVPLLHHRVDEAPS
jgi:hypothetical protein